jgi:hypothetical protein
MLRKPAPIVLLQKDTPLLKPAKLNSMLPAHESFQGISGMYDFADFPVELLLLLH